MRTLQVAARRWVFLVAAVAIVLGVLVLHREVLTGGMVYHMDDAADNYYPSRVAILRAFKEGRLPTWERGSWTGWPLISDPYYGIFYLPTAIFYWAGIVRGLGYTAAAHVLLACAGMYWLVRRRALGAAQAVFAAIAFGFSTFMVCRIRHIIFAEGLSWAPFVLAGIEGYLDSGRRRELALIALSLGAIALCGALPLLPFFAGVIGVYALCRASRAELDRGRRTVGLLVGVALGLCLGMAQIAPTVGHLPASPRALGADYAFASSYAWPDLRYLVTLVVPDAFGVEDRARWYGAFNHWEMAAFYTGLWAVLLSPLGLLRRRRELYGLFACVLIAIALAFGDRGPLEGWFFRHVPLYAALRCPTRALVMALLAWPILAAEGLAWLEAHARAWRPGERAVRAAVALAVAIVGAAVARRLYLDPRRLEPGVIMTRHAFGHFTLVLAAGLIILITLRRQARALALAGLTLVELVVLGRGYIQPKPADFAVGTERFAAVDWLIAQKPTDRFAPQANGPFRLHNLGMTYGLEGASGYGSVELWHYVNFLRILNTGAPYRTPLREDPAASDLRRFDSPLVDLLNVRWVIADHPPAADWIERFRFAPG
jgi:hypothetical protein